MKQPVFTGVCTALVTPFLNGQVNYPLAEILVHRQMQAGVQAIALAGTTGEAPTLSDEEKLELFRRGKNAAGDQCVIIAGTGSNDTRRSIELSVAAEKAGADALLVVAPYYNKGNNEGLLAHYVSIASAVSIPIILYNVPSRTGVDIPVSVYRKLSRIPNIAGVKEASSDINKLTQIRRQCSEDFYIWTGNDHHILPAIAIGSQGVISVVSNICPEETAAMTNAALSGDWDCARALHLAMTDLMDSLFCEVNPIPAKAAMKLIGYDCGACRLPLGSISPENQRKLQSILG